MNVTLTLGINSAHYILSSDNDSVKFDQIYSSSFYGHVIEKTLSDICPLILTFLMYLLKKPMVNH